MISATDSLPTRLNKLGLTCEEPPPLDRLISATSALCCFPMYMVANVHAWTSDKQFRVPIVDLPGAEAMRESFAIGLQESKLQISEAHHHVLDGLLTSAKPADRVIYEYALEGIKKLLEGAEPPLALQIRTAVAQMIVKVAQASGEGLLGTGEKVSHNEKECIDHIAKELELDKSPAAVEALAKVN